ncbi:MAG: hypothetical protein EKK47_06845 [Burkholderiales bacterium]|jgi:hypothetical protein|nr:MAG: hypothetical protein EKK47_06845 [Burkholderiales bacterium]
MRQLQTQEVKAVSGAGLLGGILNTGAQAGAAIGNGLLTGGAIVIKPVVTGTVNVLKFLL